MIPLHKEHRHSLPVVVGSEVMAGGAGLEGTAQHSGPPPQH